MFLTCYFFPHQKSTLTIHLSMHPSLLPSGPEMVPILLRAAAVKYLFTCPQICSLPSDDWEGRKGQWKEHKPGLLFASAILTQNYLGDYKGKTNICISIVVTSALSGFKHFCGNKIKTQSKLGFLLCYIASPPI